MIVHVGFSNMLTFDYGRHQSYDADNAQDMDSM